MFENYDKLNSDYIPDNSTPKPFNRHLNIHKVLPTPMYDIKNRFVGYSWSSGEYFDFNISVDTTIIVDNDSIIYDNAGEKPDEFTIGGKEGQKAYNTADSKSWTFVGKSDNIYMWVEDREIIYPVNGDKHITLHTDMTNKFILVDIFNFRWEKMYSQQSEMNESNISISVNEELSKKLLSGVYYCTVKICSEGSALLRDKFAILIN